MLRLERLVVNQPNSEEYERINHAKISGEGEKRREWGIPRWGRRPWMGDESIGDEY